ncbi:hypothetical protein AVEN_76664-1 [Araneus ventricosus]|uniref:Uncharacterized protein n=1 Tax=Araneus ventricosus TaxID=182803 RepID=A0A4Y2BQL1_ARAVE|nr:hypothetical protein AVEN_76664-1 [Araneus ventricosus]
MKLAWVFCLLLAGKLSTATPADESTPGESNMGSSGYMMAFPMDDDQVAEETAQEAVKMLAESLVSDDDDDESTDDSDDKKPEEAVTEEKKEDQTEQPEPVGILQAELEAEEAEKPTVPQRPFFKRPKIEELRKILGFPPNEGAAAKSKPIPPEKPKVFQGLFSKPKPKLEVSSQPSPLGGLQFNLRREDRMRPFGFPMLPLKRDDGFRPFGIPDLVQAASSLIRRAIVDDNMENDISKDDKEEEENVGENNQEDNDDDEEEDESLMIVPIPDSKENNMERPPLFRRFPIPLPFPLPNKPAQQQSRPRLPFPPLTPVAFFLPIAQQIMQNIRHSQPRSQPPMIPMHPPQQNFVPVQTQIPIMPTHHMPQQQQIIPIPTQQHQFIPMPSQQQHQFIPMPQPMFHQQQFIPIIPVPQASYQQPLLTHLLPNMQQRPIMRQMPRRMPMHAPQPQILQQRQQPRRLPIPQPMSRVSAPHPIHQQIISRPIHAANTRSMQRVVRPPMPPVNPILFMMPVPNMPMPMAQHQVPVYHKPQHIPVMPQHHRQMMSAPEEERVIFVRPDQDEQDDDQEVLILVPSDEVEVAQRPPMMPQQFLRQMPTPVISPIQKIRLLRDLLLARQANRQAAMVPQHRAPRVVEIVQQQLRIFPAHHHQQQLQMIHPQLQRADPSELHPVYVPYPGPQ